MAEEISTGSKTISQCKMVHNASKQTNKSHCIGSKHNKENVVKVQFTSIKRSHHIYAKVIRETWKYRAYTQGCYQQLCKKHVIVERNRARKNSRTRKAVHQWR